MKKYQVLFVIVVFTIGILIGLIINQNRTTNKDIVGTYECSNWNGENASISILDNTRINYMGQSGTYTRNGENIEVEYKSNIVPMQITIQDSNGTTSSTNQKNQMEKRTLQIVPGGLMNGDRLFKKIN